MFFTVIPPTETDVTVAWSVRLPVCLSSVTLVHHAKADGRNEMLFGKDIRVVPSNIVSDRGPGLATGTGDSGDRNPQFAMIPSIAKLL